MKSVVFIFLLLWGIVYGWTLDGKIQPGEYTSDQELINTGNSIWYVLVTVVLNLNDRYLTVLQVLFLYR